MPLKGDLSENYILFNLLDYLNGERQAKEFCYRPPLLAYQKTYINNHKNGSYIQCVFHLDRDFIVTRKIKKF